jgi:hypothetical protein
MRRLTTSQFHNSIEDIFGAAALPTRQLEVDERSQLFLSIGAANVGTSPRGVEQYHDAALEIAEKVLAQRTALPVLGSCRPTSGNDPCIAQVVEAVGERLFRRPLSEAEVARYVGVARAGGDEFGELGLRHALAGLLQSPHFLYVSEAENRLPGANGALTYTSQENASRLSYLLWDSTPDELLLQKARAGQLEAPEALQAEARRMLAAPRGRGLLPRLLGEFWNVTKLTASSKSAEVYPAFNEALLTAYNQEFQLVLEDLSGSGDLRDVFTGRTSFVSEALAPIYGNLARGASYARTPLDDTRTGLLTSGAVLAANSPSTRSSPTYRGVFALERLLCGEAPPPPGDVDLTVVDANPNPNLSVRERLEQHRTNPACAACHGLFDPLGMTFENYDGMGRYRVIEDNGAGIDTSGELEGAPISGVFELAAKLAEDPRATRCLARGLHSFALARGEANGEKGAIDALADRLKASNFSFAELVAALVASPSYTHFARPN